jgi:hypothetical protein
MGEKDKNVRIINKASYKGKREFIVIWDFFLQLQYPYVMNCNYDRKMIVRSFVNAHLLQNLPAVVVIEWRLITIKLTRFDRKVFFASFTKTA